MYCMWSAAGAWRLTTRCTNVPTKTAQSTESTRTDVECNTFSAQNARPRKAVSRSMQTLELLGVLRPPDKYSVITCWNVGERNVQLNGCAPGSSTRSPLKLVSSTCESSEPRWMDGGWQVMSTRAQNHPFGMSRSTRVRVRRNAFSGLMSQF